MTLPISVARLVAIMICLGGWPAGAAAQEMPVSPGAVTGDRSELSAQRFPGDGVTIEWTERRYKIEALRLHVIDETGIDWLGSDEVMVATIDAKGSTVSDEIGNLDTGDTYHFDLAVSCIVGVRSGLVTFGRDSQCHASGEAAPLWFEVEVWEKDPVPNFPAAGFCVAPSVPPGGHGGRHCANDNDGDDFIGYRRLEFSAVELEAALPSVGSVYDETATLHPCPKDTTCGYSAFFSGAYSLTYRITRLPDVRTDFRSALETAMSTSGARSPMEAVLTGLRSLRPPLPREATAELPASP